MYNKTIYYSATIHLKNASRKDDNLLKRFFSRFRIPSEHPRGENKNEEL